MKNNVYTIHEAKEQPDAWTLEFVRQHVKSVKPDQTMERKPRRLPGGCLLYRFPSRKVG